MAAEQWYASQAFWGAAGIAAAALTTAVSLWATRRIQESKRRLLYSMPTATPLIHRANLFSDKTLEVSHGGRQLSNPHVVKVRLTCRGRRDIPSSAFDGGQPLRLDIGAPIVDVLQVNSSPSSAPQPKWATDNASITIGPSLIKKNQTISFSLLVDGPQPRLTCPPAPLVDVDVHEQPDASGKARRWEEMAAWAGAIGAVAATVPAAITAIDGEWQTATLTSWATVMMMAVVGAGIVVVVVTIAATRRR